MLLQLGLQIVLPVGLIAASYTRRYGDRAEWALESGVFALALLFAILTARWDMTSVHLRWVVSILFLVSAVTSYRRIGSGVRTPNSFLRTYGVNAVLLAALLGLNGIVLAGTVPPEGAIDLEFPLQDGTYYIGGGGTSRWLNNHVAYPPEQYANDITRLNRAGNRGVFLPSADLDSYEMFGSPVVSPCTGSVVVSIDGHPDLLPPNRDTRNVAGNHVIISCRGVEVLLAHLRNGSLSVSEGSRVSAGDPIGLVGNSGNTTQPHLHIHAERGGEPGVILQGEGVPITYGGRFAVRNSLF
ncbi:MAG: M23 family metallopeptidase [Rhodothermales bacterium]|nr:M23 family metallopeptidase [Rhodothermales bacterium]